MRYMPQHVPTHENIFGSRGTKAPSFPVLSSNGVADALTEKVNPQQENLQGTTDGPTPSGKVCSLSKQDQYINIEGLEKQLMVSE